MKKLRHIMLFLSALFFVNAYGMERFQQNSPFQVYFAPEDQEEITNKLSYLFDNAKKQILVAVYWITDKNLTDKIIAAKNRNIDVQVAIDESSLDWNPGIISQLLKNNIVPIIYPSKNPYFETGKMHNKFVVIDSTQVFTGSANFTQSALNSNAKKFNFENVIIINSPDIAQKFITAFARMKQNIFYFLLDIVALKYSDQLPEWVYDTVPALYKKDYAMQQTVKQSAINYELEEQRKINNFFGIQSITQKEPLTANQLRILKSKGLPDKEIIGLSKQEASPIIGKILANKQWTIPTEQQRATLKEIGVPDIEAIGFSQNEAFSVISDHLRRQKGFIQETRNIRPNWEPATDKQKYLLQSKGVPMKEMLNLSKQDASDWISELIRIENEGPEQKRMKYNY